MKNVAIKLEAQPGEASPINFMNNIHNEKTKLVSAIIIPTNVAILKGKFDKEKNPSNASLTNLIIDTLGSPSYLLSLSTGIPI
jgi:hypothetical protein